MNTKKTHRLAPVDPSLFEEVARLYKGSGKTLGELATLIIAEPGKPHYSMADEGLLGAAGK